MTRNHRRLVFALAAVLLLLVLASGYAALPPSGYATSLYGDTVNAITVPERHIQDAVTVVNFDIRGFDTLGEEFILFTSVMGALLLMRRQKDEESGDHEDKLRERQVPQQSDAVRVLSFALLIPTFIFGLYIVSHGQLSPGGGFQGGVVLSSACLLFYIAFGFRKFEKIAAPRFIEILESIGASGYALVGILSLVLGGVFLQNVLPLGKTGSLTSGGIVVLIDIAVGMEVASGFILMLIAYLEELMEEKEQ
jgi:multicomponent Na+:H+ antiporter subunit B